MSTVAFLASVVDPRVAAAAAKAALRKSSYDHLIISSCDILCFNQLVTVVTNYNNTSILSMECVMLVNFKSNS